MIGYFSTVEKSQRKDLLCFKNDHYHPSNMVVSCVGDFKEEELIPFLKNKIKNLSSDKFNLQRKAPSALGGISVCVEKKNLEQSHLCIGFRSPSYLSEQRFAVDIINVILGANMSSRLYEEIREKRGLCYDISTEVKRYKDSGAFIIHLGLDKIKIMVALNSILRELARIKGKEVPFKELVRAKDYFLGQMTMSLERPQGRMFYFADSYIHLGKIYSLEDVKKKVEVITPQDIKHLAKDIFTFNNMCISCVGDVTGVLDDKIRKTANDFARNY
ncbi:MAG: insulinase family protein [Candidatus Omnitrophota bacterium]|nr:MAG: insulinase family protein [Candidatus Omnitrophota bacterium]